MTTACPIPPPPLATPEMHRLLMASGFQPVEHGYPFPVFERLRPTRRYVLASSTHTTIDDEKHLIDVHCLDGISGVRHTTEVCRDTPLLLSTSEVCSDTPLMDAIEAYINYDLDHPPLEVPCDL